MRLLPAATGASPAQRNALLNPSPNRWLTWLWTGRAG